MELKRTFEDFKRNMDSWNLGVSLYRVMLGEIPPSELPEGLESHFESHLVKGYGTAECFLLELSPETRNKTYEKITTNLVSEKMIVKENGDSLIGTCCPAVDWHVKGVYTFKASKENYLFYFPKPIMGFTKYTGTESELVSIEDVLHKHNACVYLLSLIVDHLVT